MSVDHLEAVSAALLELQSRLRAIGVTAIELHLQPDDGKAVLRFEDAMMRSPSYVKNQEKLARLKNQPTVEAWLCGVRVKEAEPRG